MSLLKSIITAAREHGHRNIFTYLYFCFFYIFNYFLTVLVTIAPYGAVNILHKLRGVKIGKKVFIDRTTYIDEVYPYLITIEDCAGVAPRAVVLAHSKLGEYLEPYLGPTTSKKVKICKGAFVGVNAVVLPGVTIGEGSVVSAGTVVNKDVPPHTVVAGNPMQVIVKLEKRK